VVRARRASIRLGPVCASVMGAALAKLAPFS
jgi:hypothetical protein